MDIRINTICEFPNKNIETFENIKYFSNCLGELHFHGKWDLMYDDLPAELRRAYDEIWSDDYNSLCYLADLCGCYGIYLIREIENDFGDISLEAAEAKKDKIFTMFPNTSVVLGKETGFDECDELIVFIPWNSSKKEVKKIDKLMWT